ncbi:MAG: sensor histidine kinase [Tannerella sp.]|jgi:signal transduction histidine kinase|nr:sensor histidine kinase [Tannerella sp.]
MKIRSFFLNALFLFFVHTIIAQQQEIDSLQQKLSTDKLTRKEQIVIYRKLCSLYENYNIEELFASAEKGLELAGKDKDQTMIAEFYQKMGSGFISKGEHDIAINYFEKALKLALNVKDDELQAIIYGSIANSYNLQTKYEQALDYYMKAMSLFEETNKKRQYILALTNIGSVHRSLFNTEQAILYLEKAEKLSEELDYDNGKMYAYYNLGDIYTSQEEYNKALEYNLKTVEISRTIGNKQAEILSLQTLAFNYCKSTQEYKKAEQYAMESLHIAELYGEPRLIQAAFGILATIYLYQERYEEGESLLYNAWQTDSTNLDEGIKLTSGLAKVNIQLGNKDKAIYFFDKFNDIISKYSNKTYRQSLADMEVKYETDKKEIRIATLEKEKQLYIWLGIAGGVVLLLAFGVLFYRHRLNVQKVEKLEQEKQLIATQSILDGETTERSRLARDLHDGLGGMLSVVKLNLKEVRNYSILDGPDVDRFKNALGILDQSITELRRVAHHMMPETLMRYGLKASVEDFCRAIPNAHFQYYGSDERLEDRLEVVLYRCAYELVNNAVKYAEATEINVQLMIDEGLVSLTIQDNGIGFDPGKVTSGSGLDNIRTRVSAYNGKMTILSSPSDGTEISIEIEKLIPLTPKGEQSN